MPADHEDGVADGHGRSLLADPAGEPPELSRQVVSLVRAAAQGAPGQDVRQPGIALVVLPEYRLAPVTLLPGAIPAHEARCPAVGNRLMSTPIWAMMHSAARFS